MSKIMIEGGCGELIEKKSRFIANTYKIEDYDEALFYIEEIKKKYWDARHNCYAFVIGENNEVQKFSDDGEPQGTAGKPILDIIIKEGIINCLVVVTRYFGGTLLGTGGLIRAYQQSAKLGLENSIISEKYKGTKYILSIDYNTLGKINYLAQTNGFHVLDTVYAQEVTVVLAVCEEDKGIFEKKIKELMNGKEQYLEKKDIEFVVIDGRVMIL